MVFSATAEQFAYEGFYKEIIFHDFGYVEHKGNIKQYAKYSFSKTCMEENDRANDYLEKHMDSDNNTITYKVCKNDFKHEDNEVGNFYGISGENKYEGENLNVIGTPHLNERTIYLYAKILGIDFTEEDKKMEYQQIEYNGYKFPFMTFKHEGLRNVQLYAINSEIVQAVGRARTISNECEVILFSNFPVIHGEIVDKTVIDCTKAA
jgi:hypothetical protein